MTGISERVSARFLEWEAAGRGFKVWDEPVEIEPPLLPFKARRVARVVDDGRRPTFLSSLARRIAGVPAYRPPETEDEPVDVSPKALVRDELVEIQAYFPASGKFTPNCERFFASLSVCEEPVTFELVGTSERIAVQFVVHPNDAKLVKHQLAAFFPDADFATTTEYLRTAWDEEEDRYTAVVEFGLGKEFMVPLLSGRGDPFVGLVGALSEIDEGETAVFQVILAPARAPWEERIVQSVSHGDGSALFVNAPELFSGAKEKTASPLFAAVVRVATRSAEHDRTWEIACNVAGALGVYGSPRGNELIPLRNDEYPAHEHETDVLRRQSRRSGMILNALELAGFVHLPSSEVQSVRLRGVVEKTKALPVALRRSDGLLLGTNIHAGTATPVYLSEEARVRHIHIVGASGTGKSTLLFNLIKQDIESGGGCSVLDPHGDLIDGILGIVPDHRIRDVVLLDPSDEEYAVGFNVLSAHSDWEKNLIASDLVAVFRRLSTAWGDQLNSVLSNALLAFMESDQGGTLFDVRRFLLEPKFRGDFLKTVRDPNVSYYWQRAFPMLTGNKSVGPVVTRLDTFLSPKPIRYMVAQKENKLDFRDILDSRRIFLAKLPEGIIGKENSHLLGSLLVSKIQSAAMSRQRQSESSRAYHALYADEFHNFLTPSLAECLSGVRKYRLGLVLAHQEMRQVDRDADVSSALLNAGTRIVYRVSDKDARSLEAGFSSFEARDLQNLSTGHSVCRIERSDWDFNLVVAPSVPPGDADIRRGSVVAASRERYGTSRADVDRTFVVQSEPEVVAEPKKEASMPPPPKPVEASPVPPPLPSPAPPKITFPEKAEEVAPAADLGRGGAQHKAIQDRIKGEAEKLGFKVVVEKKVLDGAGQIDLVLSRDDLSIACEVTVTGTIDYEVGNVSKCIKAGFKTVAVVGVSDEKLAKLSAAVANSLGREVAQWTSYHLPDAFIAALGKMEKAKEAPAPDAPVRTRGGRVVKRKVVALSPEEAKTKEEETLKIMAQMMKKKPQHD